MRPIPVVFHIGPLQVHTYGVGLALTFWFAYRYFGRRLRNAGIRNDWLATTFIWVVVAAIVGARVLHVIANFGYYSANPGDVVAIWHGGLSSFGGLALALPVGFVSARRRCPELRALDAADLVAPVLVAAWAIGRLLGPQLMEAGGGKPTSAWFGMYYAGEVGKRLPVPIFQALECAAVFAVAIFVERRMRERVWRRGIVTVVVVGLWCLSRFVDERFYLAHDNGSAAIEIASLVLVAMSLVAGILIMRRPRAVPRDAPSEAQPEVAEHAP